VHRLPGKISLLALCCVLAASTARPQERPESDRAEIRKLIEKMAPDDFAGQYASRKLAEIGEPAVPALIAALTSDVPRVRYWSIAALSSIGDERAVPAVMERLEKDEDATVRAVAVWHLGRWFDREAVQQAVMATLEDADPFVRGWAFRVIQHKRHAGAVPRLRELLESEDETVRYCALRTLAEVQGEDAIDVLSRMLREDTDPQVRAAAVFHLGSWFDRPAVRELIVATLQDKDSYVRGWALNVIVDNRYVEALPQAMALLRSEDEQVRFDAVRAVAVLKGEDAVEFLKDVVERDSSPLVREAALRSTTVLEPPTARSAEVLIRGLSDEDPELREVAVTLLRKGFGQGFGFDPTDTLGDRQKAIARWERWYRENRETLRWDPERRLFAAQGAP